MKINPTIFEGSEIKKHLFFNSPFDIQNLQSENQNKEEEINTNNKQELKQAIDKYFLKQIPDFISPESTNTQLKLLNHLKNQIQNTLKTLQHEKITSFSSEIQQNLKESLIYFSRIYEKNLDNEDLKGLSFKIPILFPQGIQQIEDLILTPNTHLSLETKSHLLFLFPLMSSLSEDQISLSKDQRKLWKSDKISKIYEPILKEVQKIPEKEEQNIEQSPLFKNDKIIAYFQQKQLNIDNPKHRYMFLVYLLAIDFLIVQSCNIGKLFMLSNAHFFHLLASEDFKNTQNQPKLQQNYTQYFENLDINFMISNAEEFVLKEGEKLVINGDVTVTFIFKEGKLWFLYPRERDRVVTRIQMYSDTYCEVNRELGFYISEGNYAEGERIMHQLKPFIAAGNATMRINREEITDLKSLGIQKTLSEELFTQFLSHFEAQNDIYEQSLLLENNKENSQLNLEKLSIIVNILQYVCKHCKLQKEQKKAFEQKITQFLHKNLEFLVNPQKDFEDIDENKEKQTISFLKNNTFFTYLIFSILFTLKADEIQHSDVSRLETFKSLIQNIYENILKLGTKHSKNTPETHPLSALLLDIFVYLSQKLFSQKNKKLLPKSAPHTFGYFASKDLLKVLSKNPKNNYFYMKILHIKQTAAQTFFPHQELKSYPILVSQQTHKNSTFDQIAENQHYMYRMVQKLIPYLLLFQQQDQYSKHAPPKNEKYSNYSQKLKLELKEQDKAFTCTDCHTLREKKSTNIKLFALQNAENSTEKQQKVCLFCAGIHTCLKCGDTSKFLAQGENRFDGYNCDMCRCLQKDAIPQMYCKQCDCNYCNLCIEQTDPYMPQKTHEFPCKTCEKQSPFSLQILDNSTWNCTICGLHHTSSTYISHFKCDDCESKYCLPCLEQQTPENKKKEAENQQKTQQNMHKITQQTTPYTQQLTPILKNLIRATIPIKLSQQVHKTQYNFLQDIEFLLKNLLQPEDQFLFSQQYIATIKFPLYCKKCNTKELQATQDQDIRCQNCRSYFGGSSETIFFCRECFGGLCENCSFKTSHNSANKFRIYHALNLIKNMPKYVKNLDNLLDFWLKEYKNAFENLDFFRKNKGKTLRSARFEEFKQQNDAEKQQKLTEFLFYQQYLGLILFMIQSKDQKETVTQEEKDLFQQFYNQIYKQFTQSIKKLWNLPLTSQPDSHPYIFQLYLKLLHKLQIQIENFEIKAQEDEEENDDDEEHREKEKQQSKRRNRRRLYSDDDEEDEDDEEEEDEYDEEEEQSSSCCSDDEEEGEGKTDKSNENLASNHLEDVRKFYINELKSLQKAPEMITDLDLMKFFFIFKEICQERHYLAKEHIFAISKTHFNQQIFTIISDYLSIIPSKIDYFKDFQFDLKDFLEKLFNIDRFSPQKQQQNPYEQQNLLENLLKTSETFTLQEQEYLQTIEKDSNPTLKAALETYLRPFLYQIFQNLLKIQTKKASQKTKSLSKPLKTFITTFTSTYLLNNTISTPQEEDSNQQTQKPFQTPVKLQHQDKIIQNLNCFLTSLQITQKIEYFKQSQEQEQEQEQQEQQQDEEEKYTHIVVWKTQQPQLTNSLNNNSNQNEDFDEIDDDDMAGADPELKQEFKNLRFRLYENLADAQTFYNSVPEIQNRMVFSRTSQVNSYYSSNYWEKKLREFAIQKKFLNQKKSQKEPEPFLPQLFQKLSTFSLPVQQYIFHFFKNYLSYLNNTNNPNLIQKHIQNYNYQILDLPLGITIFSDKNTPKFGVSSSLGHKKMDNINGFLHRLPETSFSFLQNHPNYPEKINQIFSIQDFLLSFIFENPLKNPNITAFSSQNPQNSSKSNKKKQKKLLWSEEFKCDQIEVQDNGTHCRVQDSRYTFKSILTSQGFTSGIHYWELSSDSNRNYNDIKAGVSLKTDFRYSTAFSDYPFGYAIYGTELRHNSNSSGSRYATQKWQNGGTLGVCLNMQKGQLSFSVNGEYQGVAYEDEALKKGPIYPAIAFLSQGACTIHPDAKIPKDFGVKTVNLLSSSHNNNSEDSEQLSIENYNKVQNEEILDLYLSIDGNLLAEMAQKSEKDEITATEVNQCCEPLNKIAFEFMKILRNPSKTQQKFDLLKVQTHFLSQIEQYSQSIFNKFAPKSPELSHYIGQILTIITDIYIQSENYQQGYQTIWKLLTETLTQNFNLNFIQPFYELLHKALFSSSKSQQKQIQTFQKANLELKYKHQQIQLQLSKSEDANTIVCPKCKKINLKPIQGPYQDRGLSFSCNICSRSCQMRDLSYNCVKCEYDMCERCQKQKVEQQKTKKKNTVDSLKDFKLAYPSYSAEILSQILFNDSGIAQKEAFFSIQEDPKPTENILQIFNSLVEKFLQEAKKNLKNYEKPPEKHEKYSLLSLYPLINLLSFIITHYPLLMKPLLETKIPITELEKQRFQFPINQQKTKEYLSFTEFLIYIAAYFQNFALLETLISTPFEYYPDQKTSEFSENSHEKFENSTDILKKEFHSILLNQTQTILDSEFSQQQQTEEQLCRVSVYLQLSHKLLQDSVYYIDFHQKLLQKYLNDRKKYGKLLDYIECANIDFYFVKLQAKFAEYNDLQFISAQNEEKQYYQYYLNKNFSKILQNNPLKPLKIAENTPNFQKTPQFYKNPLPKNRQNCLNILQKYPEYPELLTNKILNFSPTKPQKSVKELIYNEKQIKPLNLQKMPETALQYMKSIVNTYEQRTSFIMNNEVSRKDNDSSMNLTLKEKLEISRRLKKCQEWDCSSCAYKNLTPILPDTQCLMCENFKNPEKNAIFEQKEEEEKEEEKNQEIEEDKDIIIQNNNIKQNEFTYHKLLSTGNTFVQNELKSEQEEKQKGKQQQTETTQASQEPTKAQKTQEKQQENQQQQEKENQENEDEDDDDNQIMQEKDTETQILDYLSYFQYAKNIQTQPQITNKSQKQQQQPIQVHKSEEEQKKEKEQEKLKKSLKIFEKIFQLRQKKQQEFQNQRKSQIKLGQTKSQLTFSLHQPQQQQLSMTPQEKKDFFSLFNRLKKQEKIELLHLLEPSFIKAIDTELYQKADKLKRPLQMHSTLEEKDYDDSDISSLPDDEQLPQQQEDDLDDLSEQKTTQYLFESLEYKQEKEQKYSNFTEFEHFPTLEDSTILLFLQELLKKEDSTEQNMIRGILLTVSHNPFNAYKIFDTILFLLSLRKPEIELLIQEKHAFFEPIFEQFMEENKEKREFSEFKYLEKLLQKFASESLFHNSQLHLNAILYSSFFSKYQPLQLLSASNPSIDETLKQEKEQLIPENRQLSFTKSARIPINEHKNEEIQPVFHNVLTIFQSTATEIESQSIKQSFWAGITNNIKTNKQNQEDLLQQEKEKEQQEQEQEQEENEEDQEEDPQTLFQNLGIAYQKQQKHKKTKKTEYPNVNYLTLFQNNPQLFSHFCQTVQKDTQHLLIDLLQSDPTQALNLISHLFDNLSLSLNTQIDLLVEKGQKFQQDFFQHKDPIQQQQQDDHKKLNKEQSLDKQLEDTELTDTCNEFWSHLNPRETELKLQTFRQNFRTFKSVLYKVLYPNIILYKKIEQKHEKKLKELEEKKLEKKEKILLKKQLNDEKTEQITQAKKTIKTIITQKLNDSQPLNTFLRNYIEFLHFYLSFLGEKNFSQKLQTPVLILLQFIQELNLSYAENYNPNPQSQPQQQPLTNNLSNPDHPDPNPSQDDFPDDIPMLSRLISHKQSSFMKPGQQLKLKKNFSQSLKLTFDISSTFEMIFTKIYPLISGVTKLIQEETSAVRDSDQQKPLKELQPFFAQISLEHASQFIPINEKLEAIKKMSTERAQKNKPNLRSKEVYNQVDRCSMWSSTLKNVFQNYTPSEIVMYDLRVKFEGESGLDWGGLKNEWLTILSKEVFHPDYGLFRLSPNNKSIQPCPTAFLVPDYLTHFRMLGRLVAKAIIENWNLEVTFCKSFLKHLLNKELYIQDLEDIDPELTKNLEYILQNDIGDGEDLYQSYTYMTSIMGKHLEIELKKDGFDEIITQQNKKEFAKAVCRARMTENIMRQTIAFKQGMTDIIPQKCLQYLSEVELQRHLSGIPSFDDNVLKQMKKYAKLEGYKKTDQNIIDFFEVLESWSETMRANFLFFLTGSFKINFEGFKRNPIRITKVSSKGLPVAHTCFTQVELPEYNDKNLMKDRLRMSVLYGGGGGFHIV